MLCLEQEGQDPVISEADQEQTLVPLVRLLVNLLKCQLCCAGLGTDKAVQLLFDSELFVQHMSPAVSDSKADSPTGPSIQTNATNECGQYQLCPCCGRSNLPQYPPNPFHVTPLTQPIATWPCPSPQDWADIQSAVNRACILYCWLTSPAQLASLGTQKAQLLNSILVFTTVKLISGFIAGTLPYSRHARPKVLDATGCQGQC